MQNRRTWLSAIGSGALASLVTSTRQTMAQSTDTTPPPTTINTVPTDPFILLLKGIYEPITSGPELGLTGINGQPIDLNDGSWSKTRIYPVFGIPSAADEDQNGHKKDQDGNDINVNTTPIGYFYAQLAAFEAGAPLSQLGIAYELPGGAISQQFLSGGFVPFPDGSGGTYLEGSFDLTILDANGIYKDFKGGHNNMVDRLHQLADGNLDEFCFCHISQYEYPYAPVGVFPPPMPSMAPMNM